MAAIAFVTLTTAGVVIVSSAGDWVGGALAIAGLLAFLIAVLFQNLTGNYFGVPRLCCLPQRPEDRFPASGDCRRCHLWLETPAHRIALSRFVLFTELAGTALIIFAVTYLSIVETISRRFCLQSGCYRVF